MISVREIMTPRSSLYVMGPDDSVAAAGRAMAVQRIHHIPVLDEDGAMIGLISDRDVLAATAPKRPGAPTDAAGLRLRDIMTTRIETVAANCGIRHAALRLQALGVGCLPVVEGDALAGIVTDTDFVAVAINLIEVQEDIEPVPTDQAG